MAGLTSIGLTGILAHQTALNTTGNNITNANTPGYSRQEVNFEGQPENRSSAGPVGSGVLVQDIRRMVDDYVNNQLRSDTSLNSEQEALNKELSRLDDLLGGDATGLNNALNNFFASLQSASEDPSSLPQRQLVLSEAQGLVDRFRAIQAEFVAQRTSINTQMTQAAADANTLAANIAELNVAISESPGIAQGRDPNGLMDKRDEAIRQLSELVQIRVVDVGGSQKNIMLSSGQAIVVGGDSGEILTEPSAADSTALDFRLKTGSRSLVITDDIVGGKLGGLLRVREQGLDPALDGIGRVAVVLAETFNHQHEIGMNLDGGLGGRFFADVNSEQAQLSRVLGNANNRQPGSGVIGVEITDPTKLGVGAYTMKITSADGRSYELIDEQTGKSMQQGLLDSPLPAEITLPGFNIRVESGTFFEGDSFLITPTRNGISNMALEIAREEDLAFASPIKAEADLGNQGTGKIDQGMMLDLRNPLTNVPNPMFTQRGELSPPLQIRFTSETTYDILDATDPANPTPLITNQSFRPNMSNPVFSEDPTDPNYRGFQFTLTGSPQAGDLFSIDYNTGGVSDNRNAQYLGALATKDILNNGKQSFTEAYAGVVETIGVRTRQSQLDLDASQALLQQSEARWESMAGVNLDEEAGKLIQYQAAYNASAQVMRVAQDLFDTLLSTFR